MANYDRANTNYPFLRNFSPFYGHQWANGTSQNGADQESTSEATNFSTGLMELGLLLGNNEWRDMGMYMLRAGDTRFGAVLVQSGCNAAECSTATTVRPERYPLQRQLAGTIRDL